MTEDTREYCDYCGGDGDLRDGTPCPFCDGSGRVDEATTISEKSEHIKQLALIHSQQCMAHHGTGPEVQAAWIELCKAIDVYEERR